MKNLLSALFILLFGLGSFAQDTRIATSNVNELSNIKNSGKGSIVLTSDVTSDEVAKAAKYYTHYFTVTFDESNHTATFNMVDNTEKSRMVIARFLSACRIQSVDVDGKSYVPLELYNTYLK